MTSTETTAAQITLNGEARAVPGNHFVSDLVAELALDARRVAVELNRAIVPRSQYEKTPIRNGDAVEIVGFIGGG